MWPTKLVQSCSCVCWNFIVAHFVQTCSRAFMLFGSCRSKVSRNFCNMLQTYSEHFCVIDSSVILVSLERFAKVFTTAFRWVAFAGCASQDHDWHTGRLGMAGLSRESSGSWIETSWLFVRSCAACVLVVNENCAIQCCWRIMMIWLDYELIQKDN